MDEVDRMHFARDEFAPSDRHAVKCYQRLGYFPKLADVPDAVVTYVRRTVGVAESVVAGHDSERTLWRHREFVRARLGVVYEPARGCGFLAGRDGPEHPGRLDRRGIRRGRWRRRRSGRRR